MTMFERMQTDNDVNPVIVFAYNSIIFFNKQLARPETSKFSRSSNRTARFNTTMKDFNSKQLRTTERLNDTKGLTRTDNQGPFFQNKTKQVKAGQLSATFYEQHKSTKIKPAAAQKKADDFSLIKPKNTNSNPDQQPSNQEQMLSSQGFFINTEELKNGVTLDKVLGGNFKKIDVFGSTCKEFEAPEFFPSHIIDEKINELSEPEEGYQDDSFEILETDNEEDFNNQSSAGNKNSAMNTKREGRLNESFDVKNKDICDRISKKYGRKTNKTHIRVRTTTRSPDYFSNSTSNTQPDSQETYDTDMTTENAKLSKKRYGKENYDKEIRSLIIGNIRETNFNKTTTRSNKNNESKSLSPKSIPGTRKSRLQTTFFGDSKNSTKSNFQPNGAQLSATRQDTNNQTKNPFQISKTGLQHANNESENESNHEDNVNPKKKEFIQAYGMDVEREKNYRTQSGFGAEDLNRLRETGTKFYVDKNGLKSYELKHPIENNRIADRIQQHEKEMLEKYSNRKISELTERRNVRHEEKNIMREGSNRRLSTPVKDGPHMSLTSQRKKNFGRN